MSESEMQLQLMKDGIRFRKKRKYGEFSGTYDSFQSNNEDKVLQKPPSKQEKVFKFSKNKENINDKDGSCVNPNLNLNNINGNYVNNINNIVIKGEKINASKNKQKVGKSSKSSKSSESSESSKQTSKLGTNENKLVSRKVGKCNDLLDTIPELFELNSLKKGASESKTVYIKEYDKVKGKVKKYKESFNNEYMNLLLSKVSNICQNEIIVYKVANLYKDDNFQIDLSSYTSKTVLINLELLTLELLLESRTKYQSLLDAEFPPIGNLLLCYFSQNFNLKVFTKIFQLIEKNIEKFSDVLTIKIAEAENLHNEYIFRGTGHLIEPFKQGYYKITKSEKAIERGRKLSNEYDYMVCSEITNNFSQNFNVKILSSIFYEENNFYFTNNPSFFDLQMKRSNIYNKSLQYAHQGSIEVTHKKIKLLKYKDEIEENKADLFSQVACLEVLYMNPADLILEYLEF